MLFTLYRKLFWRWWPRYKDIEIEPFSETQLLVRYTYVNDGVHKLFYAVAPTVEEAVKGLRNQLRWWA